MDKENESKDTLKKYTSKYHRIGYTTQIYIPKKVAEHLNLEERGFITWVIDEKMSSRRAHALIMKG